MPKSWLEYSLGNLRWLTSGRLTFGWLTTIFFLIPFHKLCCFCLFCRKMSKIASKLKRAISFHSTRSSSSRACTDMEVDPPSPAVGAPSRSAPVERNVLLQEKQLKLREIGRRTSIRSWKHRISSSLLPTIQPYYKPQVWPLNLNLFLRPYDGRMLGKLMS